MKVYLLSLINLKIYNFQILKSNVQRIDRMISESQKKHEINEKNFLKNSKSEHHKVNFIKKD